MKQIARRSVDVLSTGSVEGRSALDRLRVKRQLAGVPSSAPPTVGFVHFDLHPENFHGVAVEEEKYERAFSAMGWKIRTIAGDGDVTHCVPGMQRLDLADDCPPLNYEDVLAAFRGVDLAWVINMCSLPYNPPAAEMIMRAVSELDIPTIYNHHDFPWEHGFDWDLPFDPDKRWFSVVTSEFLRENAAARGIETSVVHTAFDLRSDEHGAGEVRSALGVKPDDLLVVQPSRVDSQKNVLGGLRCALDLHGRVEGRDVAYWITGEPNIYARGAYGRELEALFEECRAAGMVVRAGTKGLPGDPSVVAYTAADLVMFPPDDGEGFGLPPIEAALRQKPVVVGKDPRVEATRATTGLQYLPLDVDAIVAWFGRPVEERATELARNRRRAMRRFSFEDFIRRIRSLLMDFDLEHLVERAEQVASSEVAATGESIVLAANPQRDPEPARPIRSLSSTSSGRRSS